MAPDADIATSGTATPLLIGRDASRIEDIWQSVYTSGYWRNDSVINTVQAGIDMTLWDIKNKEAGMPIYQRLGGPCRSAVMCWSISAWRTTALESRKKT
jgi:mannonate dehydratase